MILLKPYHVIEGIHGDHRSIEIASRTCYKSEDKITEDSANKMVKSLINRGHHSVIEHSLLSVRFICDRGVTHELVRHRLCSFSQESTRYVNYSGGCQFIIPPWCDLNPGKYSKSSIVHSDSNTRIWYYLMWSIEKDYSNLIYQGWSPQQARSILPNSTKTEIVMTANFREWRHIFILRCSKAAHPQMREIMIPLLGEMKKLRPVFFQDIEVK